MEAMKKKTNRFLWGSLIGLILLCVGVFVGITTFMLRESERTITQVVNLYMEEMNHQLQRHFGTLIGNRLLQVEGITEVVPPEQVETIDEDTAAVMEEYGRSRGFIYMALYNSEGREFLIYGDSVSIEDQDHYIDAMNEKRRTAAIGETASGETLLLYGISVDYPDSEGYPLPDGSRCTALAVGLPIQKLNEALSLSSDGGLIFSHIIRKDGSFIVRNSDISEENYFEWLQKDVDFGDEDREQVIGELKEAVIREEPYTMVFSVDGERRHVYCSHMENSEWTLVTVMPHGEVDDAVSGLGSQRIEVTLTGCAVLLAVTFVIFLVYMRMSRRQIEATEQAQKAAEHAQREAEQAQRKAEHAQREAEQAQKAAERAQKEAEHANLAKSEFLSNMSHDIRTPMNAIVGMTAIAAANIDKPEQVRNCLHKITLSSRHLLGLINDVLDMSKIESGKLNLNTELVSLRETMESLVSIVQPQVKVKGQTFNISIRNVLAEQVLCDGVRLNQILINLLSNAVKFTPEGGTISVTVAQEALPQDDTRVRTHFWVKDNGIGMTKAFQKKIFESFAREDTKRVQKTEGSGLGMAITKYIVDKMNGTIDVLSEPDQGTEFHVVLDLKKAETEEVRMELPGWKLLVVDDDELLCQDVVHSLEELGICAESARDGETAVEMARARDKEGRGYDIVLLDWKMPGMSGIETAKAFRERVGDHIPILLISAYDWSDFEAEARAAGVSGFISKPLFKSTLYYGLEPYIYPEHKNVKAAETPKSFKGVRILLAEDNELNWEIASELLSEKGFELDWAENGRQCVDQFLEKEPGYYQVILMDIRMPVMDGYEATQTIRNLQERPDGKEIPIIAMTADAFAEDINRCQEYGMNAHAAKPLDIDELVRIIERFL